MSVKITDQEKNDLYSKLKKEIKNMRELEGVAGILAKDGAEIKKDSDGGTSDKTVLKIAYIHEYGVPSENLPKRSFLRQGHDKAKKIIEKAAKQEIIELLKGNKTAEQVLEYLATVQENYIVEQFEAGGNPKWIKSERAEKDQGTTLWDTGQLVQSIHSVVRSKK